MPQPRRPSYIAALDLNNIPEYETTSDEEAEGEEEESSRPWEMQEPHQFLHEPEHRRENTHSKTKSKIHVNYSNSSLNSIPHLDLNISELGDDTIVLNRRQKRGLKL
jgi:hypothetical protein